MALALGVHAVASDAAGAVTTTATRTTQATGSTFVIAVSYKSSDPFTGVSDNKGNTYTLIDTFDDTDNGYVCSTYYCQNGVGGSGHTATITMGATGNKVIYFVEVLGAATASVLDTHSIAKDTSSPFDSPITTTQAHDIVFTFLRSSDASNSTFTLNGGFGTSGTSGTVDIDATQTATILGYQITTGTGTYSPAATSSGGLHATVATFALKEAGASTTTLQPGAGALSLNGKNPATSAFTSVRIREVLVNESGQVVANAANITLLVWYSGRFGGAPDVSLNGMTSDANGTTSWSIATGTLAFNQAIAYVAQDSVSYSNYTCARLVPSYE